MKTNTMFLSKIPQIFSYDELLTIIKQEVEVLPSIQFIMNQKDNDNNIAILKFKKKEEALRVEKKIKSTIIFNRKLNVQDYKPTNGSLQQRNKKKQKKNNKKNNKNNSKRKLSQTQILFSIIPTTTPQII
ncbi:tRNA (uracil-5-)-methyltransferase [Anaeramoeba flamelloides]|uniref:tRNA (Uracil-5-)-methyltransferase n=1 Tax=Anaeramoeba flamelloides TaxID=1746091 RepID=A0AAV8AG70_9EUKA|nr:tRNA (uracil-5-)-methyltransferase [Anaeramoeba flamelloides]